MPKKYIISFLSRQRTKLTISQVIYLSLLSVHTLFHLSDFGGTLTKDAHAKFYFHKKHIELKDGDEGDINPTGNYS